MKRENCISAIFEEWVEKSEEREPPLAAASVPQTAPLNVHRGLMRLSHENTRLHDLQKIFALRHNVMYY